MISKTILKLNQQIKKHIFIHISVLSQQNVEDRKGLLWIVQQQLLKQTKANHMNKPIQLIHFLCECNIEGIFHLS